MITPTQVAAEPLTVLTQSQVENLILLVKQYAPYAHAPGRWPNLRTKLESHVTTVTALTPYLKAVLTALDGLPEISAESQGQADSPGFFSVKANWDALAIDVLNALYDMPADIGPTSYAVVKRSTESMAQKDRTQLYESETGRRY